MTTLSSNENEAKIKEEENSLLFQFKHAVSNRAAQVEVNPQSISQSKLLNHITTRVEEKLSKGGANQMHKDTSHTDQTHKDHHTDVHSQHPRDKKKPL